MLAKRALWTWVGMLALLLAGTVTAPAAEEPPVVSARVVHSQSAYPQGGTYELAIELNIREGYHINSDQPSEPDLFPSSLILNCGAACTFSPARWPKAQPYKASWQNKPLMALSGKTLVRLSVTVAKDAAVTQHMLSARLNYQACDDQSCLMPDSLDIAIPIKVAAAGSKVERLHPEIFKK